MPTFGQGKLVYWPIGSNVAVYFEDALLDGVTPTAINDYENDATVQVTAFTDATGSTPPGFTLPISMTYQNGNGNYRGIIPSTATANLVAGTEYRCTITATAADGTPVTKRLQGLAVYSG